MADLLVVWLRIGGGRALDPGRGWGAAWEALSWGVGGQVSVEGPGHVWQGQ